MIELRAIGKDFPGVRALHDVSLAIGEGEVVGLVGENGAGKSTLVKILGGVYPSGTFRGEIVVGGKARAFKSTRDARTAGIAIVHQELSLVPAMSIAENLVLGCEPTRFGMVDHAQVHATARALMRDVLGAEADALDLDAPVGTLGVGLQQTIEIARAFGGVRSDLVILDEPTAALDEAETERLFALVRARVASGTSFVYISHRLDEIAALCDRVVVMRDGEIAGAFPKGTPTDDIVAAMIGKELAAAPARKARPGENVVLSVRGLAVAHPTLPGRRVVDGVTFEVNAGEIVALAGAMGSGRSATLAAMFGLARSATTGAVRIDGREVRRDPRAAIAAGMALVPEDRKGQGLVLGLSVADNLALASLTSRAGLRNLMIDGPRLEQLAAARVKDLAIKAPGLTAEVATLSGGNQQKVVIGKWLFDHERGAAPRVLLLDEPTRGVDIGAKAEIYRLVEELAARGTAVVLASSDLPEVVRLADRVLVLREGYIAGQLERPFTQLAVMQLAVGVQPPSVSMQGVAS